MSSEDLVLVVVPQVGELTLKQAWDIEDRLEEVKAAVSEAIDNEIRRLAAEGWTQKEIGEVCGRSQTVVSNRMIRLGIETSSKRGRPRGITRPGNSSAVEGSAEEINPEVESLQEELEQARREATEARIAREHAEKLAREAREAREDAERAARDEVESRAKEASEKAVEVAKKREAEAKEAEAEARRVMAKAKELESTFEERVNHAIKVEHAKWNPADKATRAASSVLNARNALIEGYTEPPDELQAQRLDAAIAAIQALANQMQAFRSGMKVDLDEDMSKLMQEYGGDDA